MTNILNFLRRLEQMGIAVWAEGDRLRYKAVQGAMTPELRSELSERKTEILSFLHKSEIQKNIPALGMSSGQLSFAQERLWFLDQLEGQNAVYIIPAAVHIEGPLNIQLTENVLKEIIRHHEILRTKFSVIDGKPVQIIENTPVNVLLIDDLQNIPEDKRKAQALSIAESEAQTPFDLSSGPLIRLKILKLAKEEHILLVTMHHIISDGWSIGVFIREFAELYKESGQWSVISERSRTVVSDQKSTDHCSLTTPQYADFAQWQREYLTGAVLNNLLCYWKKQLADIPALLELPTDRPRTPVQTFKGNALSFSIDVQTTDALNQISKKSSTSLFMTLYAAFAILLFRYTGQEDIIIGSPIAGRNHKDIEPLIGFFVNTLVLRADMKGNPSFIEFLKRIREMILDAYTYQDIPFEKLVEELKPERNLSRHPLFQVMFAFQNTSPPMPDIPGLKFNLIETKHHTSKFDLTLFISTSPKGNIDGVFEYSADLFNPETICRMIENFQTLLKGICENPEKKISSLPIHHSSFIIHRSSFITHHSSFIIHHLFEEQVESAPDAVAVSENDECRMMNDENEIPDSSFIIHHSSFTYQELNTRANQLAHYLISLGVGPEVRCGIFIERSAEMIIGILGILKAGGAYVPLDPDYPQQRILFTLEDAGVPVLVTQKHLLDRLGKIAAKIICIDADWEKITKQKNTNPQSAVLPNNLAYIIYTSGSTGKPKGVMITHKNVIRLFESTRSWFNFNENDVWTLFHSYAFDFSVWEIWGALLFGGRLIIVPYTVSRCFEDFYKLLCKEGVTILNQTPSAFRQLIQAEQLTPQPPSFPHPSHSPLWGEGGLVKGGREGGKGGELRLIIFGGESLDVKTLKPYFDRHGDRVPRLINMYGITETTVHVTYHEISMSDIERPGSIIGVPIPDLQTYILDRYLQIVPVGVKGELYVGGAGLSRGYLNRPELTSERFIPNPFSAEAGARLYKTGDLARYMPDGNIEYLGRIDHQVKIRGFRIELGEIETILAGHPAVKECAVICTYDSKNENMLAAYVVFKRMMNDECGMMKEMMNDECRIMKEKEFHHSSFIIPHLKTKLPDYMIPSIFIFLEAMPLTSNGKIDRAALPKPSISDISEGEYIAPFTRNEKILAKIWENLLNVERVGINDSFFALGGDSITGIQVVFKAAEAGLSLTVRQIFEHQTLSELAKAAKQGRKIQAEQGIVTGLVPLTPIMRWFFEPPCIDPYHFNQSILLSLTHPPLFFKERGAWERVWKTAFEALIRHHDALRIDFSETHPSLFQRDRVLGNEFETVDLSGLSKQEQRQALETHAASVQRRTAPGLKAVLYQLGNENRLLIVIHHLSVDAVSWRILLEDLETACRQIQNNQGVKLPSKTTSFIQWAERLSAYANSFDLISEAEFWKSQYQGNIRDFPMDFPCKPEENTFGTVQHKTFSINKDQTSALFNRVGQTYLFYQINDILLTALAQTISRFTGGSSVLIDLESHGREELFDDIDISRTVGWFTAMFPVRLDVSITENPKIETEHYIKSIKEQLRRIPHNGIGYGILRYMIDNKEIASALNINPEICFNYLGNIDSGISQSKMFSLAEESTGPEQSPLRIRRHLIDITGIVIGGSLHLDFAFSKKAHKPETIEALGQNFIDNLNALIAYLQTTDSIGYTPSDFPLADLDQQTLDRIVGNSKNIENIYPLSPMQQGMLFHTLYEPDSDLYFEQIHMTIKAGLNPEAFHHAWQNVIDRHPALRTAVFGSEIEGLKTPVQVVYRSVALPWDVEDVRHLSAEKQKTRIESFINEDRKQGFKVLNTPPLMRAKLIRTDENRYEFILSFHHLLIDGWSLAIIFEDIQKEVVSCQKDSSQLSVVRDQKDSGQLSVVRDQNATDHCSLTTDHFIAWLKKQDMKAAEAFWKQMLENSPPNPPLFGKERESSEQDRRVEFSEKIGKLSLSATQRLKSITKNFRITMNILIRCAWAILLHRLSGLDDIIFGVTVSGRPASLAGADRMVGLFINTLPVRVKILPDSTVQNLVNKLAIDQIETESYSFTSLADIQKWVNTHGAPLFETLLVFENYPSLTNSPPNSPLSNSPPNPPLFGKERGARSRVRYIGGRTNYPLKLNILPGDELEIKMCYDTGRFSPEIIRHMLDQFCYIIEQIAEQPDIPINSLSLVTPASLSVLPDPVVQISESEHESVHSQFSRQADLNPDKPAVYAEGLIWTYSDLNVRAKEIAEKLINSGIKPGDTVAVTGKLCFDLIAKMMGVFLSKGVIMPIDPNLPTARQEIMMKESGQWSVVSYQKESGQLSVVSYQKESGQLSVVSCQKDSGQLSVVSCQKESGQLSVVSCQKSTDHSSLTTDHLCSLTTDHLTDPAYIFFTSGTTGVPKAILGRHKGLAHFLDWQKNTFSVGAKDRIAQITGISFDVSLREIFLPLISGAAICIPNEADILEPDKILAWMKQQHITILHIVPSLAASWLSNLTADISLPEVRCTFFAGEPLTEVLVCRWHSVFPNSAIINLYGPTETTLAKCAYEMMNYECRMRNAKCKMRKKDFHHSSFIIHHSSVIPIGTPLPNTQALVLTKDQKRCGIGEPGEIVLRTPFRTAGYINNPEENQKRFIKNPFRDDENDILYRTGDIGRIRPDGALEFIGRMDDEIKVRGARVSIGEIEAVLSRHPDVSACAVKLWEQSLVAYIVPKIYNNSSFIIHHSSFRDFLKKQIPAYMIPSNFVKIDKLPLTPNRKIDRNALPAPNKLQTQFPRILPRDQIEFEIAKIWEHDLNLGVVSIKDHFFEVGGHSLLAVRLASLIQKRFGVRIPITAIFHYPTIEQQAAFIREKAILKKDENILVLLKSGIHSPAYKQSLFLIHPLGGTVFCYLDFARCLSPVLRVYSIQAKDIELSTEPAFSKIEDMASYYIRAIQSVLPHGNYNLCGWSFGGLVAFEMAQQLRSRGYDIGLLAMIDTAAPYALFPFQKGGYEDDAEILSDIFELDTNDMQNMGIDERIDFILRQAKANNQVPPDFDITQIRRLSSIIRNHTIAAQTYSPKSYPGNILFFQSKERAENPCFDNARTWADLALGKAEILTIACNHSDMVNMPYIKIIAERINLHISS